MSICSDAHATLRLLEALQCMVREYGRFDSAELDEARAAIVQAGGELPGD